MGIFIVSAIVVTYAVGQRFFDASIVVIIVLVVTAFLFVMSFIIVRAFEQVVRARKLELAQARQILDLKDQFVFIAAHELRNPANAIKWGLGVLKSEQPELAQKSNEVLDIIKRGNDRLLALVNDLLEVARIESGKVAVALEKISPEEALEEACNEVRGDANKKHILFNCDIGSVPFVWGDTLRMKEIFVNLLSNGVKYGIEKGVVSVSTETKGGEVIFHIENTGAGIPEKEVAHVFEKFWRSEGTRTVEGTGLGLFITKQLVELMAGRIWFTSTPNEKTVFSFSLKSAEAPMPTVQKKQMPLEMANKEA